MIASNTTPLIYLSKIGKLELLRQIYKEVYIPKEVKEEVVDAGKALGKKDAVVIEAAIGKWIFVKECKILKMPLELDKGEAAAISLAVSLKSEILLDESKARAVASVLGIKYFGTVFVLLKALEEKMIDFEEFLGLMKKLAEEGFYLGEDIYMAAVKKAKEISGS